MSLKTAAGLRVLVSGTPASLLSVFLGSYLGRIPTPGGTAYVLDSQGNVVGARNPRQAVGRRVLDPRLLGALQRGSSGSYDHGRYFVAVAVSGTPWRVVLTSSTSWLFSSVSGSRKWLPWVIYVALGLVALGFLVVLRRLLGSAVALSAVRHRLQQRRSLSFAHALRSRHRAAVRGSDAEVRADVGGACRSSFNRPYTE